MHNFITVLLFLLPYFITFWVLLLGCAWVVNKLYPAHNSNNSTQTITANNRQTRLNRAA